MPQMTPTVARVVDPILTTIARGYKNLDFVGFNLFPRVPVGQRGGQVITFGKEDFAIYDMQRAPGANTKRIHVGYAGAAFALKDYSLEGAVPIEIMQEASAVPTIDMGRIAVSKVQAAVGLRLEKEQADLATTAGNYAAGSKNVALTGNTLWSDPDATHSFPLANVQTGKEAIRAATGRNPNVMIMGPKVWNALMVHAAILARIAYTGQLIPTGAILSTLFGIPNIYVGNAIYTDAAGAFVDVWGKNVVLAYTELGSLADMGTPSYGYTYQLNGYPLVEVPYQERNPKSWFYPVTDSVAPVIAGATAGYLIQPAVA